MEFSIIFFLLFLYLPLLVIIPQNGSLILINVINLPIDSKDFDSAKNIIHCINSRGPEDPYPDVHIDTVLKFYKVECTASEAPSRTKSGPVPQPHGKYPCFTVLVNPS